jgi:hypothetical protein
MTEEEHAQYLQNTANVPALSEGTNETPEAE